MKNTFPVRMGSLLLVTGLLLGLHTTAFSQMGEFKSEFKPNTVYTVTQTQTIEGNNGGTVMDPLHSAQMFKVETGAAKGGAFPVTLTAYEPSRGKTAAMKNPVTVIEFEATTGGALRNFKQIAGEGTVAASVAPIAAAQHLEGILLNTRYSLQRKIKRSYRISGTDVSGNIAKVKFTWDELTPGQADEPNLVTKRSGTADFDTRALMYVQSETVKTSDISVPEDASGPGRQVRMKTTTRHKTQISSK